MLTRLFALGIVAACIIQVGRSMADPGDIFATTAPILGAAPAKAADIHVGDESVSATGAMTWSYPIAVPPGRNGMQPALALSYSSQAPIYGGVAAGWSMDLPMITADPVVTRLYLENSKTKPGYVTTLSGGRHLVQVNEPSSVGTDADAGVSFRAVGDDAFVRYLKVNVNAEPYFWRALALDGKVYTFGNINNVNCLNVGYGFAPLTQVTDSFGNTITYNWSSSSGKSPTTECKIDNIVYGAGPGGQLNFAEVKFNYADPVLCSTAAIGAQIDMRQGVAHMSGSSALTSVVVTAFDPSSNAVLHTRQITLAYDSATASCTASYGAFRQIDSIQESAWGSSSPRVDLPAVTFAYGSAALTYPAPSPATLPWPIVDSPVGYQTAYDLGWGYRGTAAEPWPTVEAMMLDIDGDGLIDRVFSDPIVQGSGASARIVSCNARWERNRGPDPTTGQISFDPTVRNIALPTLKWANASITSSGLGTAGSGQGPEGETIESCSLNYQVTGYKNSFPNDGACGPNQSSCPNFGGNATCSDHTDCAVSQIDPTHLTYLSYRWIDIDNDGLIDIVASITHGGLAWYNLEQGNLYGGSAGTAAPEPAILASLSSVPCPTTAYGSPDYVSPTYTVCGGMFPWWPYKNLGNGVFSARTPLIQPVPLEIDSGDSDVSGGSIVGQNTGYIDVDGDGFSDAISGSGTQSGSAQWHVYLNNGTGQLLPEYGVQPYTFGTIASDELASNIIGSNFAPTSNQGLFDMNGDGLIDHWSGSGSTPNIALNDGIEFQRTGGSGAITAAATLGVNAYIYPANAFVASGYRTNITRPVDVDLDGRPDIVTFPNGPSSSETVNFNEGAQFGAAVSGVGPVATLPQWIVAGDTVPFWPGYVSGSQAYVWELRGDLVDLDGDGIPESTWFTSTDPNPSSFSMGRIATPTAPPRLLTRIVNGRGGTTAIAYASMHNTNVVVQDPASGKASPRNQWVVKSITTSDQFSSTISTTSWKYTDPAWTPDDRDHYGFRGFDEIDTFMPSGAEHVNRYDYSVDWSGRLASSLVVPVEGVGSGGVPTAVATIDDTTWEPIEASWTTGTAFTTTTYFPLYKDHWTCKPSQTEAVCRIDTDTHTRDTYFYEQFNDVTAQSQVRLQTGSGGVTDPPVTSDRETLTSYLFASSNSPTADHYRLRTSGTVKQDANSLLSQTFAQSATTWDASLNVPLTNETWVDGSPSDRSIERFVYDTTNTGNMVQHWKPVQNAANSHDTTYTYDSRGLFPVKVVNEAGLEMDYSYEYGTGSKILISGPNTRTCGSDCINDATHPAKQTTQITVDGLGRPTDTQSTYSADNADNYVLYDVDQNTYTDGTGSGSGSATSVFHQHRHHTDSSPWVQERTDYDGAGRPFRHTSYVQGQAPADEITTTHFNNDGTVHDVTSPNPTTNDATTVMYKYTFDSLGRALTLVRPDAAQSGAKISYNGLATTTIESVGTGSGNISTTTTKRDAYGRVTEIDETITGSAAAVTTYTYDNNDNVNSVTDAQGVVTQMSHDYAGHRLSIVRPGGTWSYTYDKNGNISSELIPGSLMTAPTTIAYDDLDRPTSKLLGTPGLGSGAGSADAVLFGVGTEVFTYDQGWTGKGTLHSWTSYGPGSGSSSAAVITTTIANDAQGRPDVNTITYHIGTLPAITSTFAVSRYIDGNVRYTYYNDGVGVGSNTTSSLSYFDYRGLPWKMDLDRTEAPNQLLAYQTRNVAGFVTKRHADVTGEPMTSVESNWTYDVLGRVSSQVVQEAPGPVLVAQQNLGYYDNDDPKSLDHWLGSANVKHFKYGFDFRHQLTSVSETGSAFSATYGYGSAGRFTSAVESAAALPNSDVKVRNVAYHYQGTDPEQVTSLTNGSGSAAYATYIYDSAGNETFRCVGSVASPCNGEEEDFIYDVKGQLRRAVRKTAGAVQGSEDYWYDAGGQRLAILKLTPGNGYTELVAFNHDSETHYDGSGNVGHVYSYLSLATPFARVDRTANATTNVEYQFHGIGDSTLATVDQGGVVNASFDYAPFGEIVEATDGGSPTLEGIAAHRRRMNDKYFDEVSDLGYYGARYYDKSSITWTQGDPLFRFGPDLAKSGPRQANLYTYSLNNSLRYQDPDGQAAVGPQLSSYVGENEYVNQNRMARETGQDWAADHVVRSNGVPPTEGADPFRGPGPDSRGRCGLWSGCVNFDGMGDGAGAPETDDQRPKPQSADDDEALSLAITVYSVIRNPIVTLASCAMSCGCGGCPSSGPEEPTDLAVLPGPTSTASYIGVDRQLPAANSIEDILRPGGRLIGVAGSSKTIRIVSGGLEEAESLFNDLSIHGEEVRGSTYPGRLVQLAGGGTVGLRPVSTSGPPTVSVSIPGFSTREIKFIKE